MDSSPASFNAVYSRLTLGIRPPFASPSFAIREIVSDIAAMSASRPGRVADRRLLAESGPSAYGMICLKAAAPLLASSISWALLSRGAPQPAVAKLLMSRQSTKPAIKFAYRVGAKHRLCSSPENAQWHSDSYIRPTFISTRRCVRWRCETPNSPS